MKLIPVWRRGVVVASTKVDNADYPSLIQHRWRLDRDGYVRRNNAKGSTILMHRVILGLVPGDGLEGDHRNGNRADNRRDNLRVATRAQNQQNRRANRNGTSGLRGVSLCRQTGRWTAHVEFKKQRHWLGSFATKTEAAHTVSNFRAAHMPFAVEPSMREVHLNATAN